ncbi:MAG: M15 family metallopeptidase [Porticoccaceae bacterium]|nr:M15 family metallopeptidase [Porticoccaceae bacterium]
MPIAETEIATADEDIVFGTTEMHLVPWVNTSLHEPEGRFLVHRNVALRLSDLRYRAAAQGFDLCVCSSYRSFQRQVEIWNDKFCGRRPVLDQLSRPLRLDDLSDWQQVEAVLRWSALPGASRHHWGTDVDVYDAAAMPQGYRLQLIPEETQRGGVFASMHAWLDTELESIDDFYRPYAEDLGGVSPEPWHLSYAPLARHYAALHNKLALAQRLRKAKICRLDIVLENLDIIYERFIYSV